MRENLKHGSVRGIKQISMWSLSEVEMVEYCDIPHIEREEKQGIQSIPNEVGYGVYSTDSRRKVVLRRKKPLKRKIVSRLTKKCTWQGAGDFGVRLSEKNNKWR